MKRFKDPIYGYIEIPKEMVYDIIDTPEFQRLRYIRQTSYLPVYPAALHNRFIHSLGVYNLGKMAFNSLKRSIEEQRITLTVNIERIERVFWLACILHDVGHAPFSHSGEKYFTKENNLYEELVNIVNDQTFKDDAKKFHEKKKHAAPHEAMSVILGLKRFSGQFNDDEERALFARCITGYTFENADQDIKLSFYNALISLLNSSTIDVDRLDYLIRDAFVMGYNSVSIDYTRLLNGIILYNDSNKHISLAYSKSALSVIENVIYAHDSEKKWIQNHPVILYEIFLIQRIINDVTQLYKKQTKKGLFSLDSLLPNYEKNESDSNNSAVLSKRYHILRIYKCVKLNEKISLKNKRSYKLAKYQSPGKKSKLVSLLCDDDIIFFAKNLNNNFCAELFDRNKRRHPLWKSESEYKVIVDGYIGDRGYQDMFSQLEIVNNFLESESPSHRMDKDSKQLCIEKLEESKNSTLSELDKKDMVARYELLLSWLNCFENIAESQKVDFDFVIVSASYFESSFAKDDLKKIQIYFPNHHRSYELRELIELLSFKKSSRDKFFYVYYKCSEKREIDMNVVGKEISKTILQI